MIPGYCLGRLFDAEVTLERRRKWLVGLGWMALLLFVVIRYLNVYGDRSAWIGQPSGLYTFLSYINVTKYPPSLQFTLLTLAPALLFLGYAERLSGRLAGFFSSYGRVPFFYYILHFYLIHLLTVLAFYATGYGNDAIANQTPFLFRPPDFGFTLPVVYGIWIGMVLLLYPLCRWYGRYRQRHDHWWLSYM